MEGAIEFSKNVHVCAGEKRRAGDLFGSSKHPITRISFLGKVSSTPWFTATVLSKGDLQECVSRSPYCAHEDAPS